MVPVPVPNLEASPLPAAALVRPSQPARPGLEIAPWYPSVGGTLIFCALLGKRSAHLTPSSDVPYEPILEDIDVLRRRDAIDLPSALVLKHKDDAELHLFDDPTASYDATCKRTQQYSEQHGGNGLIIVRDMRFDEVRPGRQLGQYLLANVNRVDRPALLTIGDKYFERRGKAAASLTHFAMLAKEITTQFVLDSRGQVQDRAKRLNAKSVRFCPDGSGAVLVGNE